MNHTYRYIAVSILLVALIAAVAFFLYGVKSSENETAPEGKKTLSFAGFENGLGELCSSDGCRELCRNTAFACEAYCIHNPQNKYCQREFSFVYTPSEIGHPLMNFPQFRNYNYTFKNGGLEEREPQIENIGVEIDFYDTRANKAGDFSFAKFQYSWNNETYNDKVFHDFGGNTTNSDGTIKHMPEVTYTLPLGTQVKAITSGVVTTVKKQDTGDYELGITKPESPFWTFGYDHIINLVVKEGDEVVAGQAIGEVSNYSRWLREEGYGSIEIFVAKTQSSFLAYCPFNYLNKSIKQDYLNKIMALYISWEEYMGNSSIYSEDSHALPGCITLGPIIG